MLFCAVLSNHGGSVVRWFGDSVVRWFDGSVLRGAEVMGLFSRSIV